ncbi:hypothetical protein K469DRAFT_692278 [Zopfia rhizophila CBS 207.26]|uniref:Fungal N-terminal domain-containing protein n=1 Tax=Zopfia rhizophila CBS 207.26 TaxID=1314779 RepID=A0A6A6DS33_9PEZI|nr:hypothetical protein K469DRAFT_692278 [Zopfia rhizophila CBS 207.26]
MADIVGVVASVITVAQTVLSGIKIARELYKAPEEIQTLEEQVQIFHRIIQAVEKMREAPAESALSDPLSRAQKVIEELHVLLHDKLLGQGRGLNRARRMAWLQNKRKIVTLCGKLKCATNALCVAMSKDLM